MPTEVLADEPNEILIDIAKQLVGGNQRASMKVIYARRPYKDPNTGKPLQMAGWITWIDDDTMTGALWLKIAQGWQIYRQFGYLGTRDGYPDPLGPWQKILQHKDGPGVFPVEQLLEFGWYDPERVPVPGVRFPQLMGQVIEPVPCPECEDRTFLKPMHLARHCRNAHSYDRKDIQDLADQLGIDLVKEMYRNRDKRRTFDFTESDDEPEPEPEPEVPLDYEIKPVVVQPRGNDRQPVVKRRVPWTPERKAEASRRAKERRGLT